MKTMICCSTLNQTVNVIPALMMHSDHLVICSTVHAKKSGWTDNLLSFLEKRKFSYNETDIPTETEKNPVALSDTLSEIVRKELQKGNQVQLNIGGGQKLFTLAFQRVFSEMSSADIDIVYSEANEKKLYRINNMYEIATEKISVDLSLEEILSLYGYKTTSEPKKLLLNESGKIFAEYFKKDMLFAEFFFRYIYRPWKDIPIQELVQAIKKAVELHKIDYLNMLPEKYADFNNFILELRDFIKKSRNKNGNIVISSANKQVLNDLVNKLVKLPKFGSLYDSMWKEFRGMIVSKSAEIVRQSRADEFNYLIREVPYSPDEQQEMTRMFNEAGGKIAFTENGMLLKSNVSLSSKIGDIFEWMVQSELNGLLNNKNVSEIWTDISTNMIGEEYINPEAQYDMIVVTRFGTLIIIEVKAAGLESDTAKSKDRGAYKTSGPYGRSMIVGPLMKRLEKPDGTYPDFVSPFFIDQKMKTERAGIEYIHFDMIKERIERLLSQP